MRITSFGCGAQQAESLTYVALASHIGQCNIEGCQLETQEHAMLLAAQA